MHKLVIIKTNGSEVECDSIEVVYKNYYFYLNFNDYSENGPITKEQVLISQVAFINRGDL